MTYRLFVEPAAKADIAAAKEWYEAQRPGLELEFRDELDSVFRRIESNPLEIAMACRDVRQVAVKRFPYVISFVFRDNRVLVIAVLHGRREDTNWKSRIV